MLELNNKNTKAMNPSVFTDLCLICANYYCEEESIHPKYTLNSIETLLG